MGLKQIVASVETWASVSDERVQLLIILIWVAFGLFAILLTATVALIVLPAETWSL
ncbi:MAG: hypothetical protein ACJ8AW_13925 [Rhodopila sp.]